MSLFCRIAFLTLALSSVAIADQSCTNLSQGDKSAFCRCYLQRTLEACNWNLAMHNTGFPYRSCNNTVAQQMAASIPSEVAAFGHNDPAKFCNNPVITALTPCDSAHCEINQVQYTNTRPFCTEDTASIIRMKGC